MSIKYGGQSRGAPGLALRWFADQCNVNSSNVVCNVGGNYGQNRNYGLFYCYGNSVGNSNSNIGARNLVGVMYVATHM